MYQQRNIKWCIGVLVYVWYQPLYSPSESELILQIKDTTIYTETKSQIKRWWNIPIHTHLCAFSSKCYFLMGLQYTTFSRLRLIVDMNIRYTGLTWFVLVQGHNVGTMLERKKHPDFIVIFQHTHAPYFLTLLQVI